MRKIIINSVLGFGLGTTMAVIGYPITTVPYWIVTVIFLLVMANNER